MKIIIFAGGSGKRFWPLSRKDYPKQFQPLIDNKSTVEMMVGRVAKTYGWNNIYIPTTERLVSLIKKMFPKIPTSNIFTEPMRRDLGPAVGLAMVKMRKLNAGDEPVTILWSDNFPADGKEFAKCLKAGEELLLENPDRLIFLGEKATFANDNLGWIEIGKKLKDENGIPVHELKSFKYRPDVETARKWFKNENFVWNTGYFVTTPNFTLRKYKENKPTMYKQLEEIEKALDTHNENQILQKIYPEMEPLHFDNVVLEGLKKNESAVLKTNFKWSDPGTLYALKQFLQESDEANVTKGEVYNYDTRDSLVYNFVDKQIVTTIGLDGFVVVNTPDAILVTHKDRIGDIKNMLAQWDKTDLEKYL